MSNLLATVDGELVEVDAPKTPVPLPKLVSQLAEAVHQSSQAAAWEKALREELLEALLAAGEKKVESQSGLWAATVVESERIEVTDEHALAVALNDIGMTIPRKPPADPPIDIPTLHKLITGSRNEFPGIKKKKSVTLRFGAKS